MARFMGCKSQGTGLCPRAPMSISVRTCLDIVGADVRRLKFEGFWHGSEPPHVGSSNEWIFQKPFEVPFRPFTVNFGEMQRGPLAGLHGGTPPRPSPLPKGRGRKFRRFQLTSIGRHAVRARRGVDAARTGSAVPRAIGGGGGSQVGARGSAGSAVILVARAALVIVAARQSERCDG